VTDIRPAGAPIPPLSAPPAPGGDEPGESGFGVQLRTLQGPLGWFVFVLCAVLAVWHVWVNTLWPMADLPRNALHFAGFGVLCALLYPMARTSSERSGRLVLALDVAVAVLVAACAAYIAWREPALANRSFTSAWDYVFIGLAVLLVIELARRTTGWTIPILIVIALTYMGWWGRYVPGSLGFPGLSIETVLQRSAYSEEGMFGFIASISSTYVFMFILFGAFLVVSGAGDFIIRIAMALAGRLIGGPGYVAVIASALTGTISGSAVANTVSTGVITIPLMKKAGFPPKFAAGVEATASTGGQLMPPIMGAGAFVMANYTEIPYLDIVAVSFLPALMYFAGVGFNVRIVAKRLHIRAMEQDEEDAWTILRRRGVVFLVPLTVLIGLLAVDYTPTYAAGFAIVSVIVSSWFTPDPMGPRKIMEAMVMGARNMILTAVLLVAVGLIVIVITGTGVGNTFSLMITSWAGGSLLLAIVLIGIASLILGMGLPVTAAYIVLATLSAPALRDLIVQGQLAVAMTGQSAPAALQTVFMLFNPQSLAALAATNGIDLPLGDATTLAQAVAAGTPLTSAQAGWVVDLLTMPELAALAGPIQNQVLSPAALTTALLSAHMIIFWLSQDSNVTPPVCLTAFAAAAIAKTPPMSTGLVAWKVAKVLYIVPLLFAYTPFLSGDWLIATEIFVFGTIGTYALIAAVEGHAEAPVPWLLRPVLFGIGVMLIWPNDILINIAGTAALGGFMVWNVRSGRSPEPKPA
jgi:TRAP transporter 4TM/12TM fusion protein